MSSLTKGQHHVLDGAVNRLMEDRVTVYSIREVRNHPSSFKSWCVEHLHNGAASTVLVGKYLVELHVSDCTFKEFKERYYYLTLKVLLNHGILRETVEAAML